MEKILQPSSGVDNVGIGQTATHNLRKGPFYHHVKYIFTVTKKALTAGFASPTLAEALALCEVRINTEAKRSFLAVELDTIQQAWGSIYGVVVTDNLDNDLITTVADDTTTTATYTIRKTTFQFTIYFSEPWRKSYVAQRFFGLPTLWPNGKTVDVQVALTIPANAAHTAISFRAEEFIDFAKGPMQKTLADGTPDTASPAVLPMVNFWRKNENYSATEFSVNDWGSAKGKLQQITLFGAANDFVRKFSLKADNVVKRDTTKASNDQLNIVYDWDVAIPTLAAPYDKANVTHIALDVSDDVTDWLNFNAYKSMELAITLNQAAAANKSVIVLVQAYDIYTLPSV